MPTASMPQPGMHVNVSQVAGRQGFEPWERFNAFNRLAGDPDRPLRHLPKTTHWRRGWDSNPRGSSPGCFQDSCHQPLGHLSPRGTVSMPYVERFRKGVNGLGTFTLRIRSRSSFLHPSRTYLNLHRRTAVSAWRGISGSLLRDCHGRCRRRSGRRSCSPL